jgi:hypothetical protein
MATALTYRTGTSSSTLRTVIVEDVSRSVVLLPSGSLDVVRAKLLCGTSSACGFWAEELGLSDPHDFIVQADQVVQTRPIQIAAKARHK